MRKFGNQISLQHSFFPNMKKGDTHKGVNLLVITTCIILSFKNFLRVIRATLIYVALLCPDASFNVGSHDIQDIICNRVLHQEYLLLICSSLRWLFTTLFSSSPSLFSSLSLICILLSIFLCCVKEHISRNTVDKHINE